MSAAEVFPDEVEVRVIEYAPGRFAPIVARNGEWAWRGGIVHTTRESAESKAADEVAFQKRFWAMQLQDRKRAAVIGGVHYRLGTRGKEVRSDLRGSSGRTVHVRDLASGEVTTCSDLWYQGPIPDFARPHFPDTHEFVSGAS